MTLRREHDALRPVVLPPDEQPFAPTDAAAPIASGRDERGRVRTSAAARALASLPRRGAFLPRAISCHPRFDVHNRRRLEWLSARRSELCDAYGYVSHGVSAMLAAAAWLYAGAEFASEQAAEAGDVGAFKTAASLSGVARQHELGAWELCARESAARAKTAPSDVPWFVAASDEPSPVKSTPAVDEARLGASTAQQAPNQGEEAETR